MDNVVITVAGKGGVGKTSISACIVRELVKTKKNARILAIDADPAVGLATALNVEVKYTLDDIRKEIVASGEGDKTKKKAIELLQESKFRIIDAIVECEGYNFIAVGRPETAGCYCSVNSYLKDVISLIANEFDYVVIDGEAGIEQVNRRVMEDVTHLILVTDQSKKGMGVVKTIKKVADELVIYKEIGIIVNRMYDPSMLEYLDSDGIEILSCVAEDKGLLICDTKGESIMNLSDDSKLVAGVKEALAKIIKE
ncbi:MAG: AAA family ATPase [Bacillota bacterium]